MAAGCYQVTELDPRECPPEAPSFFHADAPRPRGRMPACEACAATEALCGRRLPCTLTGACDYAELARRWDELDCDFEDPCVRPGAEYWRPERD